MVHFKLIVLRFLVRYFLTADFGYMIHKHIHKEKAESSIKHLDVKFSQLLFPLPGTSQFSHHSFSFRGFVITQDVLVLQKQLVKPLKMVRDKLAILMSSIWCSSNQHQKVDAYIKVR